jgi:hypothetical protein
MERENMSLTRWDSREHKASPVVLVKGFGFFLRILESPKRLQVWKCENWSVVFQIPPVVERTGGQLGVSLVQGSKRPLGPGGHPKYHRALLVFSFLSAPLHCKCGILCCFFCQKFPYFCLGRKGLPSPSSFDRRMTIGTEANPFSPAECSLQHLKQQFPPCSRSGVLSVAPGMCVQLAETETGKNLCGWPHISQLAHLDSLDLLLPPHLWTVQQPDNS